MKSFVALVSVLIIALVAAPGVRAESATTTPVADIVDTAVAAGQFTTLAAALQAAGLIDALKGEGPFTVFAPTDAAFAKLPAGTVEALLADVPKLKEVLLYHVVAGKVMASQAVGLSSATTLQGGDLTLSVSGNSLKVDNATVVGADVVASNGVIHIIDTVLLPKS